jgi:Raf kinase inhibitor-like YbhB/YbcL family protein
VDPQPRAESPRPALTPLRDARITDFRSTAPGSFLLTYDVRGKQGSVSYSVADNGTANFVFVDTEGETTTETYEARRRGPGGRDRRSPPRDENRKPPRNDRKKPRDEQPDQKRSERSPEQKPRENRGTTKRNGQSAFTASSDGVDAAGFLSAEFTCDGASKSPPVSWRGAPKGTKSFAISLWHTAPDQEKSYWLIYNIPADVTGLPQNAKNIGTMGLNDRQRPEYDPMCSKGPGVKDYHLTVYALSEDLRLSPGQASRARLLEAIQNITLAENTLTFQYERKE